MPTDSDFGAGDRTRTCTPKVEEPKSSESTNSTTPAYEQPEGIFGCYLFYKIACEKSRGTGKPSPR